MKKYITIIVLLFTISLTAQGSFDKKVFLDSLNYEINDGNHSFYRIIKDYNLSKNEYIIEDYYKSGVLKMTGVFKDKEAKVRNGAFYYYFENGQKSIENYFVNNEALGIYKDWYENGNLKTEAKNLEGKKREHIFEFLNFWDENNRQIISNGNGFYKNVSKKLKTEYLVKNGRKHGKSIGKDFIEKVDFEEIYNNGAFISGSSIDEFGNKHNYEKIIVYTSPLEGNKKFIEYLKRNIEKPELSNKFNDRVVLDLLINKKGKLEEVRIYKSFNDIVDNLAIDVVINYKKDWIPANYRGVNISTWIKFPIVFN